MTNEEIFAELEAKQEAVIKKFTNLDEFLIIADKVKKDLICEALDKARAEGIIQGKRNQISNTFFEDIDNEKRGFEAGRQSAFVAIKHVQEECRKELNDLAEKQVKLIEEIERQHQKQVRKLKSFFRTHSEIVKGLSNQINEKIDEIFPNCA